MRDILEDRSEKAKFIDGRSFFFPIGRWNLHPKAVVASGTTPQMGSAGGVRFV